MLFNSGWLLLPEIHMNPLLSCFLTFQDKPPHKNLKIKINIQKLTFIFLQHSLAQTKAGGWIWPLTTSFKISDLVLSTQYAKKK